MSEQKSGQVYTKKSNSGGKKIMESQTDDISDYRSKGFRDFPL